MADEQVVAAGDVTTETKQNNSEEQVGAGTEKVGADRTQENANEGEHEQNKKKGGWQRKQEKAEQERDYWRDVALGKITVTPAKTAEEPKPEPIKEPEPKDFDLGDGTYDVQKYARAVAAYEVKTALAADKAERTETQKAEQQKTAEQKKVETFNGREAAFKKQHSDYDDVADDAVANMSKNNIPKPVADYLLEAEQGPELLYYLGQHPEELAKLGKMSPYAAVAAVGKIEAQFASQGSAEEEEPKEEAPIPPVKKAPAPPTPVTKPSSAAKVIDPRSPESDKLSADEWLKLRLAQESKKGK